MDIDDDLFDPLPEFSCDSCGARCVCPFYSFPTKKASIDFCSGCFIAGALVHPLTRHWGDCRFCGDRAGGWLLRVGFSRIYVFACHECALFPLEHLRRNMTRVTDQFRVVQRRGYTLIDLSPGVTAVDPRWAALLEDVVAVPPSFGPVKNWTILEERGILGAPETLVCILLNARDGRVGAAVSDPQCRTHLAVLFMSRAEWTRAARAWDRVLARQTARAFERRKQDLQRLVERRKYDLNNYLGFLTPGICAVVDLFNQRAAQRNDGRVHHRESSP